MYRSRKLTLLLILAKNIQSISGFSNIQATTKALKNVFNPFVSSASRSQLSLSSSPNNQEYDLKAELKAYLKLREEKMGDQEAQKNVGKVIGGTKGNVILDYVSGSPNKPSIVEEAPNPFDYDELNKYGYGYLVKPIMDAGGRNEMYRMMDMPIPALPKKLQPKKVRSITLDRDGSKDEARYKGLKMGQVLDDNLLGERLAEVQKKKKEGSFEKPKLAEELYVQPFAEKRNVSPRSSAEPEWTPERIDQEARKRGQAIAWANRAKAGEFKKDTYEVFSIEGPLRTYCILSTMFVSFAFGRASPSFLMDVVGFSDEQYTDSVLSLIQYPALAILIAGLGSSIVSGAIFAPSKNRNPFIWGIKGLLGGPVAVFQVRDLESLKTLGELEQEVNL